MILQLELKPINIFKRVNRLQFFHTCLKILSGRNSEKTQLSNLVLKVLPRRALTECSISVKVIDIVLTRYAKILNLTHTEKRVSDQVKALLYFYH